MAKPRRKIAPAPTIIRRRPGLDVSRAGLIFCAMLVFMGLAAMNTQANLLFGIFGLMVGILVISVIATFIVPWKLLIRRKLPGHGVVGEPMPMAYEITNGKRLWPSLSVSLAELDAVDAFAQQPQCYMLHASAKVTVRLPVDLVPKRRGLIELNQYQLTTSFPFGLISHSVARHHRDIICVFPALAEVDRHLITMCRAADNMGESVRPRAGGSDEFYGLREYRPGDNPRHIYWRRSARTGVLVAREMTHITPPRLMLLVDTYVADSSPKYAAWIERAIAMAASLASAALEQDMAVGVCAWSGKPLVIAPSRGKQQREEVLTLLARLPANVACDGAELAGQVEWMIKSGTTLVILSPRDLGPRVSEHSRGGSIVLSAESEARMDRFRFRPEVTFGDEAPAKRNPKPEFPKSESSPNGEIRKESRVTNSN